MSDRLDSEGLRLALEGGPADADGELAAAVERARGDIEAIVHGLRLLAAEAPAPVTVTRGASRPRWPAVVAVACVILAAGVLGLRGFGWGAGGIADQPSGAIRDPFSYVPGSVGVMVSPPGLVTSCRSSRAWPSRRPPTAGRSDHCTARSRGTGRTAAGRQRRCRMSATMRSSPRSRP
jgi:hypothetical protein